MNAFKQLFFGGFLQTKDNNQSIENQLENESLTEELLEREREILIENQLKTIDKFKRYIKKKYQAEGLLITKKQLLSEAISMYRNYREAGFIGDNCRLIKSIEKEFV